MLMSANRMTGYLKCWAEIIHHRCYINIVVTREYSKPIRRAILCIDVQDEWKLVRQISGHRNEKLTSDDCREHFRRCWQLGWKTHLIVQGVWWQSEWLPLWCHFLWRMQGLMFCFFFVVCLLCFAFIGGQWLQCYTQMSFFNLERGFSIKRKFRSSKKCNTSASEWMRCGKVRSLVRVKWLHCITWWWQW